MVGVQHGRAFFADPQNRSVTARQYRMEALMFHQQQRLLALGHVWTGNQGGVPVAIGAPGSIAGSSIPEGGGTRNQEPGIESGSVGPGEGRGFSLVLGREGDRAGVLVGPGGARGSGLVLGQYFPGGWAKGRGAGLKELPFRCPGHFFPNRDQAGPGPSSDAPGTSTGVRAPVMGRGRMGHGNQSFGSNGLPKGPSQATSRDAPGTSTGGERAPVMGRGRGSRASLKYIRN